MTIMSSSQELTEEDKKACDAAQKFTKLFYEAFDKRRQVVSKLYEDGACIVWNGEALTGQQEIGTFLRNLPYSKHEITTIDAQVVNAQSTNGETSIMVLTSGSAIYGARKRSFTQTFILSTDGELWKIKSDRYRFID